MTDTLISCCCKPCCKYYLLDGTDVEIVVSGWTEGECTEDDPFGFFKDTYDTASGTFIIPVSGGIGSGPGGAILTKFYDDEDCTPGHETGLVLDQEITLSYNCNETTGVVIIQWLVGETVIASATGTCPQAAFTADNGVVATITIGGG